MQIRSDLRRKLYWVSVLYFAEGFPFGVAIDNLPVYFRVHGVSLTEIGLLGLVGLPWTLKVFWAPLVDRFGQRRHWTVASLVLMAALVAVLPLLDPATPGFWIWTILLLFTAASATQDIAIDAYTIGLLAPGEEGVANGVRTAAYRVALIVSGGGLVIFAGRAGWPPTFWIASAILLGLAVAAVRSPAVPEIPAEQRAWLAPLRAWIRRPAAFAVLGFVLIYKLGDAAMGPMVKPFWLDRGLTVEEIGFVSTSLGVGASLAGALLGGVYTSRAGIFRALWVLGLVQAVSNLGYAGAAELGGGRAAIYSASLLESFTGGLGTAAFLAFLMHICDKRQAATEYALLSSLFGLTRTLVNPLSGWAADSLGYASFFALTFFLALPAYALLPWVRGWIRDKEE
ncbi:MAG: AmpG family muropeptide MFS transporter [Deltaproteobacteria bacterium]|nr:AmpG family muropeptide MFS transporter [Deltaproteobacteria bacterium]